ncbi:hypothetical protein PUN28_020121 [Cardiocondyla obscurior]|uniref:PI31 proteasome regulator N-terminal domain-containing protein n=1 Tax=Cardiocondyla obscurior TaxID=286306 RepID=A0AAW2EAD9_9HYME
MEILRRTNRTVDISEPILAEDSTFTTIALSLKAILEQLDVTAKHHDYLVALLLVLLAECGFSVTSTTDPTKWEKNTRLVSIPTNWKSQETGIYEIYLTLRNIHLIDFKSKLIVIPYGDKLVVNLLSHTLRNRNVYCMVVQTLKYVNPYTSNLFVRYMNVKELSHRFKNMLAHPLHRDILLASNLMGPCLECLPTELRLKILNMLPSNSLNFLYMYK